MSLSSHSERAEREYLEGLRYEDKFPDEGEVSGMGLLRHSWTIHICPNCSIRLEAGAACPRCWDHPDAPMVAVALEVVPSATYQGAVEALEAIHGSALGGLGTDERAALEQIIRIAAELTT